MLDFSFVLFLSLTALTAVVWTHSWICDRREQNGTKREELSREAQPDAMFAAEEA
jgi:hypothetical protein